MLMVKAWEAARDFGFPKRSNDWDQGQSLAILSVLFVWRQPGSWSANS